MSKTQTASGFFPHLCPRIRSSVQRPHGRLPTLESLLYLVCGFGSIIYVTYRLYRTSQEYQWLLNENDFVDGWSFLNHKKDISDYEWSFWSNYFWKILPWMIGHVFLARIIEVTLLQFRKQIFLMYSVLCVSYLLGWSTALLFAAHAVICFLASSLGSFLFVWIVAILLLSTLNYKQFTPIIKQVCGVEEDDKGYYLVMFVLAFAILRYTSFCLERSKHIRAQRDMQAGEDGQKDDSKKKAEVIEQDEGFGVTDLLLYLFYLPLFFCGPMITYDKFRVQMNSEPSPWTRSRIITTIKGFVRVIFWAMFLELSHHFLYISAIPSNIGVIREMSPWALAALGYYQGQYFMVKYVIMYDLPGQIARLDDLDPPLGPKCISYIYRYSDMWKYFDRGLYTFLRNYIYIPLGGSQSGLIRQLLASMAAFFYIYVWHGEEYYLWLWCVTNYVACSLELIGGYVERSRFISNIESSYLSPAMVRRIRCVVVTPLFLMSCFAIFYFFSGVTVGDMFIKRILINASMQSHLVLFFLIYANLQNAMEVERWLALRAKVE